MCRVVTGVHDREAGPKSFRNGGTRGKGDQEVAEATALAPEERFGGRLGPIGSLVESCSSSHFLTTMGTTMMMTKTAIPTAMRILIFMSFLRAEKRVSLGLVQGIRHFDAPPLQLEEVVSDSSAG